MLYTFLICYSINASLDSFGCCGCYCFLDFICSSIRSFCWAIFSCSYLLQGFSQYSWEHGCFFLFHPRQQTQGRDISPTIRIIFLNQILTRHFCVSSIFFVDCSNFFKTLNFVVESLYFLHKHTFVDTLKYKSFANLLHSQLPISGD